MISRLESSARISVQPYIKAIINNKHNPSAWHWQNLTDLFLHLQQAYNTTDKAGQSAREMAELIQGPSTNFNLFIAEFIRIAAELQMQDAHHVSELKSKVSPALQQAAANIFPQPGLSKFDKWVTLYRGLSENIADMQFRVGHNRSSPINTHQARDVYQARGDPMDLNALSLNRISQSERDRQLALELCLYCSKEGYTKNNCPKTQQKAQHSQRYSNSYSPAPYLRTQYTPHNPYLPRQSNSYPPRQSSINQQQVLGLRNNNPFRNNNRHMQIQPPLRRLTPGPQGPTPRLARLRTFG